MMKTASRLSKLGAAALLAVSAVGTMQAHAQEKFTYMTNWYAQAEHGGFYQAVATGLYKKYGLDVTIKMGGPQVNIVQMMAAGQAECVMGSSDLQMIQMREGGVPVVNVAAVFQKDPQVLIAHEDVKKFEDLKGKTILIASSAQRGYWPWLKAKYGFTDAQVRPYAGDLKAFLEDRRAVQQGYLTSEPYRVEQEGGFEPKVFLLADDGYPSYAAMVLAPNAFARDNAAALRSFIAASAEGWRDYLRGDASAADALIRKDNPDMTQAMLDQARDKLRDNAVVDGGDAALYGLGAMTEDRWRAFFEATSQTGVYDPGLNWREAFTNAYLPGRG